ncbi:MAG TPA: pyridoxal-phosphate dependent enzyme [Candidatus Saccharimonadales bacterium]|nr:pyridoxal-phosphate dependent enzyme [Candidatus Saccharimonadales bacterium]
MAEINIPNPQLWQERLADLAAVRPAVIESPLVEVPAPGDGNNRLLIKCEQYQAIRSFKIRGAMIAMTSDLESLRKTGVVADSGGNHSQAVAQAGAELGVPVQIIMAAVVPPNKVAATRKFGATDGSFSLDNTPESFVIAKQRAKQVAIDEHKKYLSPYDDPAIVRGTATLVPEIVGQLADKQWAMPDAVHIPIGGGGLISGIADVNAEQNHLFDLFGYGITGADSAARSLRAVREHGATEPAVVEGDVNLDAEGLAVWRIGDELFARIKDGKIDDIHTVPNLAPVGAAYKWYIDTVMPALGIDTSDKTAVWDNLPEVSSMVTVAGVFEHLKQTNASNQTHLILISGSNTDEQSYQHTMDAYEASV